MRSRLFNNSDGGIFTESVCRSQNIVKSKVKIKI